MSIGKIGVIGAGNMGSAFVRGWLKADPAMARRITVMDANPAAAARLSQETGVSQAATNADLVKESDLVLLAVKPADVDSALKDALALFNRGKILASVVAGRTIASYEELFPEKIAVFRLMPNVAVEVGAGTICFVPGGGVDPGVEEEVLEIFGALGRVISLPEKLFSSATALSGSGPGFLALIAGAFVDAGVTAGLPLSTAMELTTSMMSGTAKLLTEGGLTPSELRHKVTSPAGTTAAGLAQLERDGVRSAIIDAVQVAVKRANELG